MRLVLIVGLLMAMALGGCGDPRSDIDSSKVVSADVLLRQHKATLFFLSYEEDDLRGWPARDDERRTVRILQDAGITVAFGTKGDQAGTKTVMVGVNDSAKLGALRDKVANGFIDMPPCGRRAFGLAGAAPRQVPER